MSVERGPLVDEHVLRRALRLDAEELPARLDPALIAAASRAEEGRTRTLLVAVAVAFVAGWGWSEAVRVLLAALAGATGIDPLATALSVIELVARQAAPLAAVATAPAVPLAILAAALAAILVELRGRIHAAPS